MANGKWLMALGHSHQRSAISHDARDSVLRWIVLVAALVVLDASLTFENVWPTPAVHWRAALSVELAVCVLGLAIVSRWASAASSCTNGCSRSKPGGVHMAWRAAW